MTRQEEIKKAILETELTHFEIEEAIWEKKKAKYIAKGKRLIDPDKMLIVTSGPDSNVLKTVEMIKQALDNGKPFMIHKPTFKK